MHARSLPRGTNVPTPAGVRSRTASRCGPQAVLRIVRGAARADLQGRIDLPRLGVWAVATSRNRELMLAHAGGAAVCRKSTRQRRRKLRGWALRAFRVPLGTSRWIVGIRFLNRFPKLRG